MLGKKVRTASSALSAADEAPQGPSLGSCRPSRWARSLAEFERRGPLQPRPETASTRRRCGFLQRASNVDQGRQTGPFPNGAMDEVPKRTLLKGHRDSGRATYQRNGTLDSTVSGTVDRAVLKGRIKNLFGVGRWTPSALRRGAANALSESDGGVRVPRRF